MHDIIITPNCSNTLCNNPAFSTMLVFLQRYTLSGIHKQLLYYNM